MYEANMDNGNGVDDASWLRKFCVVKKRQEKTKPSKGFTLYKYTINL